MESYETISLEATQGGVAVVTLNRPDALNALNAELMGELADALKGCQDNDKVRCIRAARSLLCVTTTKAKLSHFPLFCLILLVEEDGTKIFNF